MQEPLPDVELFQENPEPRCPVVLALDTSQSMDGQPIAELNAGLQELERSLKQDRLAALRVELAVVAFGARVVALDVSNASGAAIPFDASKAFAPVERFHPPRLTANGQTPLGEAVQRGLDLLEARKAIYRDHGIDYFRPWLLIITDGVPTDPEWKRTAQRAKQAEREKRVVVFPIAVANADLTTLAEFSSRAPLTLKGLAFDQLFNWVSRSLSGVARSQPGDDLLLAPIGWAKIES